MSGILPVIQALADPISYAVFNCVRQRGGEAVYDLLTGRCDCGEPPSLASSTDGSSVPCPPESLPEHLQSLVSVGLVEARELGRRVHVRVNAAKLGSLAGFFAFVDVFDPSIGPF